MGVPARAMLVPGLAAIEAVAGHSNAAANIRIRANRPTSERGIDRSRVYALPLEKGQTPVEERSSSECAAVEAQIVGHVLDPVFGLVRTREHVPHGVEPLVDHGGIDRFAVGQ